MKGKVDYSYLWYKDGIATSFTDTIIKPTQSGIYKVKITNCYNKTAISDSTKLSISTISKPAIVASKNPICANDSSLLSINAVGYQTKWLKNEVSIEKSIDKTEIIGYPSYSYQVTISDTIGCSASSDVFSLVGIALPVLTLNPNGEIKLCKGSELNLNANSTSGTLRWSTGSNQDHIIVSIAGLYKIETWFDVLCISADSVNVVSVNPPEFKLKSDTTFCFGKLVPLELTAPEGYSYNWNGKASNQNTFQPNGGGIVILILKDINNCTTLSTMNVNANCETPVVHNVFTPNGDRINDQFEIENLLPETELKVYNRWGAAVYNSSNYNNNWQAEGLIDGLYYYSLVNKYYQNSYKGWVEIAR